MNKATLSRVARGGFFALLTGVTATLAKSEGPMAGRDYVSPVILRYGQVVREDMIREWGGLTQAERQKREECISGFSVEACR